MSQQSEGRPTERDLLVRLAGDNCTLPACDGTLDRQPFKGTNAVVCDECGTPQVRVWDDD